MNWLKTLQEHFLNILIIIDELKNVKVSIQHNIQNPAMYVATLRHGW